MRVKLSENIKRFRKERKMTQEQLAEAMGVSASAVYKWESGQTSPDLSLIFSMADLFGTSTDVLLGYEWQKGSAGEALRQIRALREEKHYGDAVAEAEKALKKFPNNFNIVYQGGLVYLELSRTFDMSDGTTPEQEKAHSRGIELFEHACELLPQNTDESISEVSIRRKMAALHTNCTYAYRAIDVLKNSNVCGVNNALIGMLYADLLHDTDEAEKYFGKAFGTLMGDVDAVLTGFVNVFFQKKDYDSAIDCVHWLRKALRGIQPEEELTQFDKYDCVLLSIIALCCCFKGDYAKAKQYNKEALEKAIRYDAAGPEDIRPMKIYEAMHIQEQPSYGVRYGTAMECLEDRFSPEHNEARNWEVWQEAKMEVMKHETV